MGKDSEIAEAGRAMREYKKSNRAKNLEKGIEMMKDHPEFEQHSEYHWSVYIHNDRVDYWPSAAKWSYRGKITHGQPQDLLNFIVNRSKKKRKKR